MFYKTSRAQLHSEPRAASMDHSASTLRRLGRCCWKARGLAELVWKWSIPRSWSRRETSMEGTNWSIRPPHDRLPPKSRTAHSGALGVKPPQLRPLSAVSASLTSAPGLTDAIFPNYECTYVSGGYTGKSLMYFFSDLWTDGGRGPLDAVPSTDCLFASYLCKPRIVVPCTSGFTF